MSSPSSSGGQLPPPQNPFLSAYESFQENTPLFTRTLLSVQVLSYLVSWLFDTHDALANIPERVIFQFQIYRLVLSPLVNTQLITLVFAFLSFLELGKRLEYSMGTAAFAWFCAGVALMANVGFLAISVVLSVLTAGDQGWPVYSASGIWLILFGAIAAECSQAPVDMKRRFFFCEVPVFYYPVALFALFAVIGGGPSLAYAISMAAGYAFGQGRLENVLRLSSHKANEWENGALSSFTSQKGWVYGHAALGTDAWSQMPSSEMGSSLMSSSLFQRAQAPTGGNTVGSPPAVGSVIVPGNRQSSDANTAFAGSAGHILGGRCHPPSSPRRTRPPKGTEGFGEERFTPTPSTAVMGTPPAAKKMEPQKDQPASAVAKSTEECLKKELADAQAAANPSPEKVTMSDTNARAATADTQSLKRAQ